MAKAKCNSTTFDGIPAEDRARVAKLYKMGTERHRNGRKLSPIQIYRRLIEVRTKAVEYGRAATINVDANLAASYLWRVRKNGVQGTAERDFENSMLQVIRAFNLTEHTSIPWSFPDEVKAKAEALCRDITTLFHRSDLIPRIDRLTRRDAGFERFLDKLAP